MRQREGGRARSGRWAAQGEEASRAASTSLFQILRTSLKSLTSELRFFLGLRPPLSEPQIPTPSRRSGGVLGNRNPALLDFEFCLDECRELKPQEQSIIPDGSASRKDRWTGRQAVWTGRQTRENRSWR